MRLDLEIDTGENAENAENAAKRRDTATAYYLSRVLLTPNTRKTRDRMSRLLLTCKT